MFKCRYLYETSLCFSVSAQHLMVTLKKLASTIIFKMYQSSTQSFGLFFSQLVNELVVFTWWQFLALLLYILT
jgi:hypothetical protein